VKSFAGSLGASGVGVVSFAVEPPVILLVYPSVALPLLLLDTPALLFVVALVVLFVPLTYYVSTLLLLKAAVTLLTDSYNLRIVIRAH
jgi:hypothetical protein